MKSNQVLRCYRLGKRMEWAATHSQLVRLAGPSFYIQGRKAILATAMKTAFKSLTPAEVWEESQRRSLAIGIAGWAVVGSLQASGAIPTLYRPSLAPASGLVATFLTALVLFLAHYHGRWRVGACMAVIAFCLPYAVNLVWARFSHLSLLYPLATVAVGGAVGLYLLHRRYSGPTPDDDVELILIDQLLADFHPTWMERITALCIIFGLVLLLILLLR